MRRIILVLLSAVLLMAACGGGDGGTSTPNAGGSKADSNFIDVLLQEYAFVIEGDAQAGPLTLNFDNVGEQVHQAIIGKLDEGKTIEDLNKALQQQGPPPPWFDDSPSDMLLLSPGERTGITIDATEGTYALLCFVPDPKKHKPHASLGMVQTIEVKGEFDGGAPAPDAEIALNEKKFEVPDMAAGDSTVEVTNEGKSPAVFAVVEFAQGKDLADADKWLNSGLQGPPPATFFGGTQGIKPGASVTATLSLDPGTYTMVASYGSGKNMTDVPVEFTVE